jgi:glycosyltransferase involved in cell wall biosynthesis
MKLCNKKILYFIPEDWFFVSHRFKLAQAAQRDGYDVVIVTNISIYKELIESAGMTLYPSLLQRRNKNIYNEIKAFIHLYKIFKRESPDIVHNVTIKSVLFGSVLASLTSCKSIVNAFTGRGSIFLVHNRKYKILQFILKLLLTFFTSFKPNASIFQNSDDINFFKELNLINFNKSKVCLIRSAGVDIETFHYTPTPSLDAPIVFSLVSRLIWHKGIKELLGAVKILKDKKYNFKCLLVGDPDGENPTSISKKSLESWHESGLIEWIPKQSDIVSIYKKTHVAVLPSYCEGLPKSLLEAGACGKPIITTDVPGCREVINKETGILVLDHDDKSLAEAMEYFICNPGRIEPMGIASRTFICENFEDKKVFKETLNLYNDLINSNV